MGNSKKVKFIVFSLIVIIGLIPIESLVNPEYKLKVVDENLKPLSNVKVYHTWRYYGLEFQDHEVEHLSDHNGEVLINRQVIKKNIFSRVFLGVYRIFLIWNPHISTGPHCYTFAKFGKLRGRVSYNYLENNTPPKKLLMKELVKP